jgi:hypothetical protein
VNLTTKRILKCLKTAGRYGDGLYLQVNTPGRGSWLLRYERNGRERALGLGKPSDFSLHEARQRAKAARQLLADGLDPIDAKKTQRQQQALEAARNITFQKLLNFISMLMPMNGPARAIGSSGSIRSAITSPTITSSRIAISVTCCSSRSHPRQL